MTMKLVFTKMTGQAMLFLTFVLTYNFLKELNMPSNMPSKLAMSLLGLLFSASTVLAQAPAGGTTAPAAGAPKGPAPGGAPK